MIYLFGQQPGLVGSISLTQMVLLSALAVTAMAFAMVWWRERQRSRELTQALATQASKYVEENGNNHSLRKENQLLREALSAEGEHNRLQDLELRTVRQALRLLDIEISSEPRLLTTPAERPRSKEIVFQLQVNSRAKATALASSKGLPLMWGGDLSEAEHASAYVPLLHRWGAIWTQLMGQPWQTCSWSTLSYGMHFLSVEEGKSALVVSGTPSPPWGELRKARLQLLGRPPVTSSQVALWQQAQRDIAVHGRQSNHFASCLFDCHRRWQVDAIAVLNGDGVPLATTEPFDQPILGRMAPHLLPMIKRIWARGWELQDLSFRMSSADKHIVLRALDDSPKGRFVLAMTPQFIEERAIDALARSLRWNMQNTQSQQPQPVV